MTTPLILREEPCFRDSMYVSQNPVFVHTCLPSARAQQDRYTSGSQKQTLAAVEPFSDQVRNAHGGQVHQRPD